MATDEKMELLRSVPLFRGLRRDELERLVELADEVDVPDGQLLTRQGALGDEFFVVLSGHVIVARDGNRLVRLGPGEFLGEIALIDARPRTASATADGPARLLVLSHRAFDALLDESPTVTRQVVRTLVERMRRTVTVPQFGIFAQGTIAHAFVEWTEPPGRTRDAGRRLLGRERAG